MEKTDMQKRTMSLPVVILIGFALLSGGCKESKVNLTYEGSSTISNALLPEAAELFEKKTGISFTSIGRAGSGKGFKAVMNGECDIAGMSRGLKTGEKKLSPYYQIIGYDAVAIFINAKNPVTGLSNSEIKNIFSGKITNWSQVGGTDGKIEAVIEPLESKRATLEVFTKQIMGSTKYGSVKEIELPLDCVQYVADNENAITYASTTFLIDETKIISYNNIELNQTNVQSGAYELSRPLIIVSKNLPDGASKQFFSFILSDEGQELVKKYFVGIK